MISLRRPRSFWKRSDRIVGVPSGSGILRQSREERNMRHTIIYHGRHGLNFDRLCAYNVRGHLHDFTRIDGEGKERDLASPSRNVDGIVFGYMERTGEGFPDNDRFFAVRVQDIVLENPIQLVPRRHTDGKWFAPKPSQFGDESARALLSDIIAANPAQRASLMEVYNQSDNSQSVLFSILFLSKEIGEMKMLS